MAFRIAGMVFTHLCPAFGLGPAALFFSRLVTGPVVFLLNRLAMFKIQSVADFDSAMRAIGSRQSNHLHARWSAFGYIDDYRALAVNDDRHLIDEAFLVWTLLFRRWNLPRNEKKFLRGGTPSPTGTWLGWEYHLGPGDKKMLMTADYTAKVLVLLRRIAHEWALPQHQRRWRPVLFFRAQWDSLVGLLLRACEGVLFGRLNVGAILKGRRRLGPPRADAMAEILNFWLPVFVRNAGAPIVTALDPDFRWLGPRLRYWTDAALDESFAGWGWWIRGAIGTIYYDFGEFPAEVRAAADINALETATAIFAFDTINRHDLLGDCPTASHGGQQHPSSNAAVKGVLHGKTDNTAAVAAIARGRADNDTVRALARRLQSLQGLWKTAAESSHVPGVSNQPADHLSRGRLAAFFASFPANTVFRRLQTTGPLLSSVCTTLSTSH